MKSWGDLAPVIGGMDGVRAEVGVPMSRLTSLGVGGPVDLLVMVETEEALVRVLAIFNRVGCPWFTLGAGTNLLVTDGGIEGAAVVLHGVFRETRMEASSGAGRIVSGAGVGLRKLLADVMNNGMSGLEFLTGIPGSVGGAVIMNAGTLYGFVESALVDVRLATPEGLEWVGIRDLDLGYRRSDVPIGSAVASARFDLKEAPTKEQEMVVEDLKRRRLESQPPMEGTAGSFFKNPDTESEIFAGGLIEEAGLKGMREGEAFVSEVHANFLTNGGGAAAADLLNLACRVREEVKRRFGQELEPEVRIVGRGVDAWWARLGVGQYGRRSVTGQMEALT